MKSDGKLSHQMCMGTTHNTHSAAYVDTAFVELEKNMFLNIC